MEPLKMYFLLKMWTFHCYVGLPEGNIYFRKQTSINRQKQFCVHQKNPAVLLARLAYREENKMIDTFDPMTQRKEHRGCVFDGDTVKRLILLGEYWWSYM